MTGNVFLFHSMESLSITAAEFIAATARRYLRYQSQVRLCLAGGRTPAAVYGELSSLERQGAVPFDRIEVLFGDERCVAPDHRDSNYRMAKEAFGTSFDSFSLIRRMEADRASVSSAVRDYARYLATPIDILLLGMGPDGHVASLFPGRDAVLENRRSVVMVDHSPKPPATRMSISPRVIRHARTVVVMAGGQDKASAVRSAIAAPGDPRDCPARLARRGTWLLDYDAARQIMSVDIQK